jgi:hypothetical protein
MGPMMKYLRNIDFYSLIGVAPQLKPSRPADLGARLRRAPSDRERGG